MLLEFDLYSVRVFNEKLQYSIGPPPLDGEVGDALRAKFPGERLNVIGLETQMTEQGFAAGGVRLLEKLEKAAAACVQEKSIAFAGRVAEFMGDLKAQDTNIKFLRGRQVTAIQADV